MARTWWQQVVAKVRRVVATRPRPRRRRPLTVETLEDRTLLAVSVAPGLGNTVGILGTNGDAVWLRTNAANLQYGTDGTNYSDLGVTVTQDVTVTFGALGKVHLGSTSGDQ